MTAFSATPVTNGVVTASMFLIGLTGGIASGKSTVSSQFQRLGCPIIDADKIAREGKLILM